MIDQGVLLRFLSFESRVQPQRPVKEHEAQAAGYKESDKIHEIFERLLMFTIVVNVRLDDELDEKEEDRRDDYFHASVTTKHRGRDKHVGVGNERARIPLLKR